MFSNSTFSIEFLLQRRAVNLPAEVRLRKPAMLSGKNADAGEEGPRS
jgi:hypothetical protein